MAHVIITDKHRAALRLMGWIGPDDEAAKEAAANSLALELISYGVARFERSPHVNGLLEFCFDGLRYLVKDMKLAAILSLIGEEKITLTLAKCRVGEL